jgi:putative membrane protein
VEFPNATQRRSNAVSAWKSAKTPPTLVTKNNAIALFFVTNELGLAGRAMPGRNWPHCPLVFARRRLQSGRYMRGRLKEFLQRWIISTVAVLVATYVVPGIHYQEWPDLLMATFILGLLNTFLRPLMLLLSLPLLIVTLGLFTLVINALLLLLVSGLLSPRFHVDNFKQALLGALVIALVTVALNSITRSGNARVAIRRGNRPPPGDRSGGDGPVIDV